MTAADDVIVSQPSNQFRGNNNTGNKEPIVIWTLFLFFFFLFHLPIAIGGIGAA